MGRIHAPHPRSDRDVREFIGCPSSSKVARVEGRLFWGGSIDWGGAESHTRRDAEGVEVWRCRHRLD